MFDYKVVLLFKNTSFAIIFNILRNNETFKYNTLSYYIHNNEVE
jgi:hypothetical protein